MVAMIRFVVLIKEQLSFEHCRWSSVGRGLHWVGVRVELLMLDNKVGSRRGAVMPPWK